MGGFERFHRQRPDAAGGRVLLQELACASCHASTTLAAKRAPSLRDVGARAHHEHLTRYLMDPASVKPGTTMPRVLQGTLAERKAKAEALTAWLVSRSRGRFEPKPPDLGAAVRGAELFHRVGCAACHAPREQGGPDLSASSVPLPDLASKYTIDGLRRFLERPLELRPSGRMPDLALNGREAHDIACFLLQDVKIPGTWRYAVFPGRFEGIDAVAELDPQRTGLCDRIDLGVLRRRHFYVVRYSAYLHVTRPGPHRFTLTCDDDGRVTVGGTRVIDLRGNTNSARTREGEATLEAGWHEVVVEYMQRGRESTLAFACEDARGPFAGEIRAHEEEVAPYVPLKVDPALAKRGEELYESEGCKACHEPDGRGAEGPPALAALPSEGGCLEGAQGTPTYGLDEAQRAALTAALGDLEAERSPPQMLRHHMTALNCYACHERDGIGGVPEERDDYFTCGGEDQGLEGRIPPTLTGIGDKLRPHWVRRALDEGVAVRPLIHTRMPRFGPANVAGMADLIVALDRPSTRKERLPVATDEARKVGRALVGRGGFNCVACHRFNERDGAGMQMTDLTLTTDRMHHDWFVRWMRDPGKLRPGTRMPSYTGLSKFLDGDLGAQIDAVWTYLADGQRAVLPEGVSHQAVELVVGGEAIVYRGKLREAGFRGIAVAHPERVNLSFDALGVRYVQLWKGRFLNVGAHWRSQGMGRVGPSGHARLKMPAGPMWAHLEADDAPWPTGVGKEAGFHFGGYRLDAVRRPTFRYRFGDLRVQDGTVAPDGDAGLTRRLAIEGLAGARRLHGRLALGKDITVADGAYVIDGGLRVTVRGGRAYVVGREGTKELRVIVPGDDGRATLEVDYRW